VANVHDVAAYILSKMGEMPATKLHKLAYYSQAWALVWDEEPLFGARIEAWANGPAIPELYQFHRGDFKVSNWTNGDITRLTKTQKATIKRVLAFYGDKSSQWLINLTHSESPWIDARGDLQPGERGSTEIQHGDIADYYSSL
jgi:uncharacterized phage-associated protein